MCVCLRGFSSGLHKHGSITHSIRLAAHLWAEFKRRLCSLSLFHLPSNVPHVDLPEHSPTCCSLSTPVLLTLVLPSCFVTVTVTVRAAEVFDLSLL